MIAKLKELKEKFIQYQKAVRDAKYYEVRGEWIKFFEQRKEHLNSLEIPAWKLADLYEKMKNLSAVGTNPDVRLKKESLDFLMFIENNAKKIDLGSDFEQKLTQLIEEEKTLELASKGQYNFDKTSTHNHNDKMELKLEQEEILISHHEHTHEDGTIHNHN